jgi:hypothetical protein
MKAANSRPVNGGPLSDTTCLGKPKRANVSLNTFTTAAPVVLAIKNASTHFDDASTKIKKVFPCHGPKKSTCNRVHISAGYSQGRTGARGGAGASAAHVPHAAQHRSMSASIPGHHT